MIRLSSWLAPIAPIALLAACAAREDPPAEDSPRAVAEIAGQPAAYDSGLPELATVREAIDFVVDEQNLARFRGPVAGSERYLVELPSGATVSNWKVDSYFHVVFRPFGEGAFAELAPLLNHEHEFVRVGAYAVLNSFMYARGIRYRYRYDEGRRMDEAGRMAAIEAVLAALEVEDG